MPDARIASQGIAVYVEDGTVALTGRVDGIKAKRSAEENAWNTK
jgi:osmotically-inducible protein OsmY